MGFFKDLFSPKAVVPRRHLTQEEALAKGKRNLTIQAAGAMVLGGSLAEKAAFVAIPAVTDNLAAHYASSHYEPQLPQGWIEADEVSDDDLEKFLMEMPARPATQAELDAINENLANWPFE